MLGATGNKIVFQVGIDDAEILARFIDDMSESDFVGMPKYTAGSVLDKLEEILNAIEEEIG